MNKKKIIFFSNTFSPYQRDFLDEVSKKNHIKAIFNDKQILNLPWDIKLNKFSKDISHLNYINRVKYYLSLIKNYKANIYLIGGYNLRDVFSILFLINRDKNKKKIYYFLEKPKNNYNIGLALKILYLYFFFKLFSCNAIFAVGKSAQEYYRKLKIKVFNLPYSINGDLYKRVNHKISNITKFIFIGQLIDRKGINFLLSASEQLNNSNLKNKFQLSIIGRGSKEILVKKLTKKFNNLTYYGFISPNKLPILLKKQHVLILPSKSEGWGVVVNEAMASGLALILNKNMEITKDFFKENINGVLFQNSTRSLFKKMKYMIENKNKIMKIGFNNYKFFNKSILNSKNSAKFFLSKI